MLFDFLAAKGWVLSFFYLLVGISSVVASRSYILTPTCWLRPICWCSAYCLCSVLEFKRPENCAFFMGDKYAKLELVFYKVIGVVIIVVTLIGVVKWLQWKYKVLSPLFVCFDFVFRYTQSPYYIGELKLYLFWFKKDDEWKKKEILYLWLQTNNSKFKSRSIQSFCLS